MRFKEITLRGNAYERGFTYGQLCKDEIRLTMKGYEKLYFDTKGVTWEDARKVGAFYLEKTRDFNPDYVEEMRGIAEGAELDILDIVALNCRTEIMYADSTRAGITECTCLTVLPPATEGGHTIASQNWDYSLLISGECLVVVHVYQDDKPHFMMVVEGAGMIGGIGMNDRGVSVLLNALRTPKPVNGIPFHVRLRAMLEAENLCDAYVKGSHAPYSVGNLIATHSDGIAIEFEMDSEIVEPIIPEDGVIIHTNHYVGPKTYLANDVNHMGSTYIRMQRMKTMVKERYGKITVEDIKKMYSDHAGYPYAICDHEDPRYPVAMRDATNFSIIMDHTDNRILVCPGNPCEYEYEEYSI